MIFLDTTVLLYAVGDSHPLKPACQEIVRLILSQELQATTTIEVIQEFTHVRSRRRSREDAARYARSYAGLLQPLVVIEDIDLHAGLEIFEQVPRLGAFDAVLAAVARRRGASSLVSADTAFGLVSGLSWIAPDALLEGIR